MKKAFSTIFVSIILSLSFIGVALAQVPYITSLDPRSGTPGTYLTINGENFSTSLLNTEIFFRKGSIEVKRPPSFVSASGNKLAVYVPSLDAGRWSVGVLSRIDGEWIESSNALFFEVEEVPAASPPHLISLSPHSGSPEDYLRINGENFASGIGNNTIFFTKGTVGEITDPTGVATNGTWLETWIPSSLDSGAWEIEVRSNVDGIYLKSDNTLIFTVLGGEQTTGPAPSSPETNYTGSPGMIENPLGYSGFEDLVNAIINFIWKLATPLAAIMFVISGIMFVTSVGDPEKVKTAKKVALYTAIGYAIIIMASGLIKVLQSLFQGS